MKTSSVVSIDQLGLAVIFMPPLPYEASAPTSDYSLTSQGIPISFLSFLSFSCQLNFRHWDRVTSSVWTRYPSTTYVSIFLSCYRFLVIMRSLFKAALVLAPALASAFVVPDMDVDQEWEDDGPVAGTSLYHQAKETLLIPSRPRICPYRCRSPPTPRVT